ncbi:hypothetical protein [Pseudonocardia asaccharolytica]|uniref:hypothetical protein n=1 Tax=Pseudonocardia asaccharolytica TaxID=54010 RepID=UPI0011BD722E|nr:hypothetical protein [Pseudonocardia asaccharolytica]
MTILTVTLDTLTASHGSYGQHVDDTGTAWILTGLKGWTAGPGRRTAHSERPTADGAHRSAAYRGTRTLELVGRMFPPTVELGWEHADRLAALCPDPGERYPLVVQGAHRTLVAYVEQAGDILIDPVSPRIWDWSVPLVAADPYRYDLAWTSASAAGGDPGSGGIDFGGSGADFSSPGLDMGTAPAYIDATVAGAGTAEALLVLQVTGPTNNVQVEGLGTPSVVGVRGAVAAGEALFVNCTGRVAFDVPGCAVPIPARGAVLGGQNARGAIWVSGGWPALLPGELRTFRMSGATGPGSSLTVHARGAWV